MSKPVAAVKKFGRNTLGRDFVVGDIHGAFDMVLEAMGKAGFNPRIDRLFSVGDLIDRGPGSHRCVRFLAQPYVYAVRGNHEQMLLDLYADGVPNPATIEFMAGRNGFGWWLGVPDAQRTEILEAVARLPLAIEIDTGRGSVGLIHADVPAGMGWGNFLVRLEAGDPDVVHTCLWGRERVKNLDTNGVAGVGRVFAGHTPQWDGALRLGNFYYIDSGAVFGQLGVKDEGCLTMAEATTRTQVLIAPRQLPGLINLRTTDDCAGQPFGSYAARH